MILSLVFILVKSLGIPDNAFGSKENIKHAYYIKQLQLGYVVVFPTPQTGYGKLLAKFVIGTDEEYYYARPILEQYFMWLRDVFTKWDWGESISIELKSPATEIIFSRIPVSLSISAISTVVSVPLGILLGIIAGLKKNTWVDYLISTLVMVLVSIPFFVIVSLLMYFFCFQNQILPSFWPTPNDTTKNKILAYIIPVVALSLGPICGYARSVRAELCDVMSSEYLLLARTKGLTKKQAITRHALKNAFVPLMPSILAEVIFVVGGSLILERLYGIPGIGDLLMRAINEKDYPVLMVDLALVTIIDLLAGIVFDLSYGFLDPRIRMGEKK